MIRVWALVFGIVCISALSVRGESPAPGTKVGYQFYDIEKIIDRFELLSLAQRDQLKALADGLEPREEDYPTLARISQKVDRKVRKDLLHFEDLFLHLRKCIDSKYFEEIAPIREVELSLRRGSFERITGLC